MSSTNSGFWFLRTRQDWTLLIWCLSAVALIVGLFARRMYLVEFVFPALGFVGLVLTTIDIFTNTRQSTTSNEELPEPEDFKRTQNRQS